jgi:hypothetical protein
MRTVNVTIEELLSGVALSMQAVDMALEALDDWDDTLNGRDSREAVTTLMTIAMVVLVEVGDRVEAVAERHGRGLTARMAVEMIAQHALRQCPAKHGEEKSVDDLPTRPVKPGPSPWGL